MVVLHRHPGTRTFAVRRVGGHVHVQFDPDLTMEQLCAGAALFLTPEECQALRELAA